MLTMRLRTFSATLAHHRARPTARTLLHAPCRAQARSPGQVPYRVSVRPSGRRMSAIVHDQVKPWPALHVDLRACCRRRRSGLTDRGSAAMLRPLSASLRESPVPDPSPPHALTPCEQRRQEFSVTGPPTALLDFPPVPPSSSSPSLHSPGRRGVGKGLLLEAFASVRSATRVLWCRPLPWCSMLMPCSLDFARICLSFFVL